MTDYHIGETIYIMFTTRAFATGAPTVLSNSPVVSAYEQDSLIEITTGVTLGVDHDGVVGLNLITIVATGANNFEALKDYNLVITTGEVASVSVIGEVVGSFSLQKATGLTALSRGQAQGGTAGTIQLSSVETFATNELKGNVVKIVDGTGIGQSRWINANIGATDTCSVVPDWITTPDSTSHYEIVEGAASMQAILDSDLTETSTGRVAGNFDTFYDNADAVTTKVVDDVGAGTLVPSAGWTWSTATSGVPNPGRLRGNNATIASITELSIHQETADDRNAGLAIGALRSGDRVGVFFAVNPDVFLIFDVTATPVLTGEVWAITGTVDSTAGAFANTSVNVGFQITGNQATVDAVWNELKSAHTTPDSFGDFLDDEITSRAAPTDIVSGGAIDTTGGSVDNVALTDTTTDVTNDVGITQAAADKAWLTAARTLTASDNFNDLSAAEVANAVLPPQNVALDNIQFLFVSSVDHVTPVTSASTTAVTRAIDGAAFAAGTGTLAEIGNGIYQYDASQADMNGKEIIFRFTATGGTPAAPDDAFVSVTTGG